MARRGAATIALVLASQVAWPVHHQALAQAELHVWPLYYRVSSQAANPSQESNGDYVILETNAAARSGGITQAICAENFDSGQISFRVVLGGSATLGGDYNIHTNDIGPDEFATALSTSASYTLEGEPGRRECASVTLVIRDDGIDDNLNRDSRDFRVSDLDAITMSIVNVAGARLQHGTDINNVTRTGPVNRTTIRIEDNDRDSGVKFWIQDNRTTLPSVISENLFSSERVSGDSRYNAGKEIQVFANNLPRTGWSRLEFRFSGTARLGIDYDVKAFQRTDSGRHAQNWIDHQPNRNEPWIQWRFGGAGFGHRYLIVKFVVKDDSIMEDTESIIIDIDAGRVPLEGRVGVHRRTVRIFDNDRPAPAAELGATISEAPAQFGERLNDWESRAAANFHSSRTITLSIPQMQVDLVLSIAFEGTATRCADYVVSGRVVNGQIEGNGLFPGERSGSGPCNRSVTTARISVPVRQTSFSFRLKAIDDSIDEQTNETVVINLGRNNQGATVARSINLRDNDPWPRISISSPMVVEGNAGDSSVLRFEVTKSGETARATQVDYQIDSSGTATLSGAGKDITHTVSSPLSFAPDITSRHIEVAVDGDNRAETDETVVVRLFAPVNLDLPDGAARIATGTIVNDDFLEFSISDASVEEADLGQTTSLPFTVRLGAHPPVPVSVQYEVTGGASSGEATEGVDFTGTSGTLTFRPGGSLTERFSVFVIGDDQLEQHETLTVALSNPQCDRCPAGIAASLKTGESTATGTILDNEAVHISVNAPTVTEGAAGETSTLTFEVTLSKARNQAVTVEYNLAPGGTAESGADFEAFGGSTLVFDHTQSETLKTVTVTVMGDSIYEKDETVLIGLSNPTGGTVLVGIDSILIGTGTITNDDDAPLLEINSPGEDEGDEGGTAMLRYEITKTGLTALPATVSYSISDTSTATSSGDSLDYVHTVISQISFAATETLKTIDVAIVGDGVAELDETVVISLVIIDGARFANEAQTIEVTGTIRNDDELPLLAFGPQPTVTEGDAGDTTTMRFEVTKEGATALHATVSYTISGEASSSGTDADFTHTSASLTIPVGEDLAFIDIDIVGDDLAEMDETVVITLFGPVNARFAGQAATIDNVGTIATDDFIRVTIDAPEVAEGAAGSSAALTFTATLEVRHSQFVSVEYEVITTGARSGTAIHGTGVGDDFAAAVPTGTLTFAAGIAAPQTQTFSVTVRGDDTREPNETVVVRLHSLSSNAEFPGGSSVNEFFGTGTIINDDDPSFTVGPARAIEGAENEETTLIFTVTMSPAWNEEVTVDYGVTGGTESGHATAGVDFREISGTLTYAPGTGGATGETVKTISVLVLGDNTDEVDEEEVTLTFSNVSANASIQRSVWTGVIVDDDDEPVFSIDSPRVDEGNSGLASLIFTVSRSGDTQRETSVAFAVEDGTAVGGDGNSDDYIPLASGQLDFAPSEASKPVEVQVRSDVLIEADETVMVTLSSPVFATLDPNHMVGTGTIANDDQLLFSIDSPDAIELDDAQTSTMTFTVTLSAMASAEVTVDYAIMGDTAIESTDFEAVAANTLIFGQGGVLTQTIDVTVIGDQISEGIETLTATLSRPACDVCPEGVIPIIESGTGVGRIIDNEAVHVSVNAPSVLEGDAGESSTLDFEVTLGVEWDEDVTVSYALEGGTAAGGSDFESLTDGVLTFSHARREVLKSIQVPVIGDDLVEDNEIVLFTLANLTGRAIFLGGGSTLTGMGTIENDDYSLSVGGPPSSIAEPVAEGGTSVLEFPITLQPAAEDTVSVQYSFSGSASEGSDFTDATVEEAEGRVLVFAEGETSKSIVAQVNSDFVAEDVETVTVSLSAPTGAYVASEMTTATGTIRPSTATVTLAVEEPSVNSDGRDGSPMVKFGLRLSTTRSSNVPVDWVLSEVIVQEDEGLPLSDSLSRGVAPRNISTRALANGRALVEANRDTAIVEESFNAGITLGSVNGQLVIELARPGAAGIEVMQTSDIPRDVQAEVHNNGRAAVIVFNAEGSRPSSADFATTGALSAFGRSVAIGLVETVWNRAEAHRYGRVVSSASLGGRVVDVEAISSGADAWRAAREAARLLGVETVDSTPSAAFEMDDESRLSGDFDDFRLWSGIPDSEGIESNSRFTLAVGEEVNGGSSIVYWGASNSGNFESELGASGYSNLKMSGSTRAISFGFDIPRTERTLLGFVISRVSGDTNYHFANRSEGRGWVNANLTSATPWFRWRSQAGPEIWGAYGIGWGDAQAAHSDQSTSMDLSTRIFAFGAWNQVGTYRDSGIAAKADVFMASVSTEGASAAVDGAGADSRRIRLAAEMGPDVGSPSAGQRMSYKFELGARHDSGDAASGIGVDTAAGFHYVSPGGSIQLSGRGGLLLFHGQDGLSETGLGFGLSYDPGADIRGIQLSLEPAWNAPRSNAANTMWNADSSSDLSRSSTAGAMVRGRIGYAVGAVRERALATLYSEAETGSTDRRLRLGAELRGQGGALERLTVELYGEREESQYADPEHAVLMEGRVGF